MSALVGRRTPRWLAPAGVGGLVVVATSVLLLVDPARWSALVPACPFRALTGLDCPGCGGTRAVYALTQGEPLLALDHNLLAVGVLLPLLGWAWMRWLVASVAARRVPPTLPPRVSFALAGGVLGFWVLRNLPWGPFVWLGSGPASG